MDQKKKQACIRDLKKLVRLKVEELGFSKMRTTAGPRDFLFSKDLQNDFSLILQPDIRSRDGAIRLMPSINLEYAPLEHAIQTEKPNTIGGVAFSYLGSLPGLRGTEFEHADWYFEFSESPERIVDVFTRVLVEHAMPAMVRYANVEATIELFEARVINMGIPSLSIGNAPVKLALMRKLQSSKLEIPENLDDGDHV